MSYSTLPLVFSWFYLFCYDNDIVLRFAWSYETHSFLFSSPLLPTFHHLPYLIPILHTPYSLLPPPSPSPYPSLYYIIPTYFQILSLPSYATLPHTHLSTSQARTQGNHRERKKELHVSRTSHKPHFPSLLLLFLHLLLLLFLLLLLLLLLLFFLLLLQVSVKEYKKATEEMQIERRENPSLPSLPAFHSPSLSSLSSASLLQLNT